jgi:preprotein translocase subunit SecG
MEEAMHTALMIILLVASVVLIISILLQSGNSDGLSGSIAGGAEQLFGKRKSRGYDALLSKITTVAAIVYIVISLAIVAIFN